MGVDTGNETRAEPAGLSDAKRELLERRLRGKRHTPADHSIPPRPQGVNPLSFGQERIWFQCQLSGSAPSLFNIAFLAHIDGPLDIEALQASINAVIERHEAMRAGFHNEDGAPEQFILSEASLKIKRVDLRSAADNVLGELRARADIEARASFDLAAPPLMRVTLFELAPARYALLFVVHHIVWDGWSSGVFIEEVTRLYQAASTARPSLLPALTTQYADFAHWHRGFMTSEAGARQIDYWRKRLVGLPELISLPTDRPRVARQSHEGAAHEWKIPGDTLDRLTALANRLKVTQFTILLAAYNVLLMHYSGQRDIGIGAALACRTRPMLEKLTGFFANMLVMRTYLEDDPAFEVLVKRTYETSIEAQSHQEAPFDLLVEALQPKRSLSHNPLFQVAFIQHHLPIEELRIGDLRINFENLNAGAAAFDLVLHIYGEAPGLKAVFEYDAQLFDARSIEAMATHFNVLLDDLLLAPVRPISQSRLLTPEQQETSIAHSSTPMAPPPRGTFLHDLIDLAAPESIAVVCGDERMSYGELIVRSTALAHRLRARGVGPEKPVALLIDASIEMIIAILGVLQAGGAYLPLDPAYPAHRIRDIVGDCGARTAITTSAHLAGFALCEIDTVLVNDLEPITPRPSSRLRDENLAYIIYTSGSTGLSKGVMISHRAAVASTRAREQFYPEKVTAFLLLSSISFDSSIAGIFWTLSQGGALHIATEAERRDPAALARLIERAGISHLLCLPSLYSALLDIADRRFSTLRCCIVAGEACHGHLAERHLRTLPNVQLVNEYGPTECAVWSTAHKLLSGDIAGTAPIGRPIPGAQAVIVGANYMQPQGAAGELHIAGAGLARGYAGRPDLTADRFRPNPFGAFGERLYRTGDRARLNANGEIDFLGRIDEQLKIRGYRVDPREIESIMLRHPDVSECIVAGKEAPNGATRLIAYCRIAASILDEADLRLYASIHLPGFMIPDHFVALDQAPRLPNGKIDRNALPDVRPGFASDVAADAGEGGVVELLLADIWREVLGLSEVRGSDNFFDLGGNSLAAMQVAARAQRVFHREVPVAALFESANLHDLATVLERSFGGDFEGEIERALAQIESEPVD